MPGNDLARYEFYEIMVRLAYQKYIVSHEIERLDMAVQELIDVVKVRMGERIEMW
jgi:hypothetical protein